MDDYKTRLKVVEKRLNETSEKNCPYFKEHNIAAPSRTQIIKIIKYINCLMFPKFFSVNKEENKGGSLMEKLFILSKEEISKAFAYAECNNFYLENVGDKPVDCDEKLKQFEKKAEEIAIDIIEQIPHIKCLLLKDIQAIFEGDPAALSPESVILSYPGFFAIAIYRIAHEFYLRNIPYISRLMTEYGHEKTGIDIHAGAKIGEYFCIDHGTGIVIGETTVIGNHVKIYQGVTLGAKSFELDEKGNPVKGIKRHPNIGNNVIIYANATILGGSTFVGDNCVIGANVWVIKSVESGKVIYYTNPEK